MPWGPNRILQAEAVPNPDPRGFVLKLAGSAERVQILLYTRSMVRVDAIEVPGPASGGWFYVPMPSQDAEAANGSYYFVAFSIRQGEKSLPCIGKYFIAR